MKRRAFFKLALGVYGLLSFNAKAKNIETLNNRKDIEKLDTLCLIGIGGGGTNILEDISDLDNSHTFIHINSDYNSLKQKSSKHKLLLGWNKKHGLGCGGNDKCGKNLINSEIKNNLDELTTDSKTVYIVTTLGGGVGSGATPEIVEYLKKLNKKIIVCATVPFSFEGKVRSTIALNSLDKIKKSTDKLIIFKNDNLLRHAKYSSLGIKDTFQVTSKSIWSAIKNETRI